MAKRVLTEEDFKEGEEIKEEDTSKSTPEPDEIVEGKKEEEEPETETKPSKGEEEPEPSEEKKYKYASMDEYDKAYKEAERKMHEATTAKAEVERKLAQFDKPKEPVVTIDDRIREMTKETINKIRLLPTESPTREDDAGFLWAKLSSDVDDLKHEERTKRIDMERNTVKKTYDRAIEEGLKTDAELEWLGYEFSKTDSSIPLNDRISDAIVATKKKLTNLRNGFVEKQERDKKEKENLKVLGRGSSRQEKSEKEKEEPSSMSEQLARLNEKRRIKKDDLHW